MNTHKKIAAVVNPSSAGGKTAKRWPEYAKLLEARLGTVVTHFTDAPRAATAIARELLRQGYNLLIAVGGDGTVNEVANGFFEQDQLLHPDAVLGIIPTGTGGDFRRTLGISTDPEQAVKVLACGAPLEIDVGKATFHRSDGAVESRYFVNLVSFGMGGQVAARSHNALTVLGGKAAFLWATLTTFLTYRGREVQLSLNSDDPSSFLIANVAIGNGQFHGAGMRPCPTAVLNDSVLEVTVIDYAGMFELIRGMPALYSGEVYSHPKVHHLRASKLSVHSSSKTEIEIDGEALGTLPLEITVLPARLPILIPATSPLLATR